MENVIYLEERRPDKIYNDSNCLKQQSTLDSLGNNLMAMLWLTKLAHSELQNSGNQELAKKHLQNALKAGDSAKKLMRKVLDSQEPHEL
jgi:hypothetical protein